MSSPPTREAWGTRLGLILAAAGNAVGIGNLLRFPSQAAQNGGGAFMIPYVVSLLLFGLPMMWIAWTVGRMGGRWHHGTTPGIFDRLAGGRYMARYFGVIGLALPVVFVLYYTYIESWCLGYAWFSLTGSYSDPSIDLKHFYQEFLGNSPTSNYFGGLGTALTFLGITLVANVWILYRGVSRGIELLAKIAIPLLMLFCLVLGVRVLTLGQIEGTPWDGLQFLWKPDLGALTQPGVWMAAAGQIFFTLSIGFGSLECYGSYLRENDDIALTGLTTASLNEFVEVLLGSMIAIPAAAAYYGVSRIEEIADSGAFAIGMISMPEILRDVGGVGFFGTMWFLLLFFAAFTSSVAVAQPAMAFLQDEMKLSRGSASGLTLIVWLLGSMPVVFLYKYGALDEMDFWAGTLGLVVFAIIEVILFAWVFGIDKGWKELNRGAEIKIPRIFKPVMKWVTPFALLAILGGWLVSDVIQGDKLSTEPAVVWGVSNLASIDGQIRDTSPDEGSAEAAELDGIEGKIVRAVKAEGRDLSGWLRLTIFTDQDPRIIGYQGDPALRRAVLQPEIIRWAELKNLRLEPFEGVPARAADVEIAIEGRYRATALWATRFVMVGFTVGFVMMIWAIWHRRRVEAA